MKSCSQIALIFLLLIFLSYSYTAPVNEEASREKNCTDTSPELTPEESLKILEPYVSFAKVLAVDIRPVFEAVNSFVKSLDVELDLLDYETALKAIESIDLSQVSSGISTLGVAIKETRSLVVHTRALIDDRHAIWNIMGMNPSKATLYFGELVKLFDNLLNFLSKTIKNLENEKPLVHNAMVVIIREMIVCVLGLEALVYKGYCPEVASSSALVSLLELQKLILTASSYGFSENNLVLLANILKLTEVSMIFIDIDRHSGDQKLLRYLCKVVDASKVVSERILTAFSGTSIPDVPFTGSNITFGQVRSFINSCINSTKGFNGNLLKLRDVVPESSQEGLNIFISKLEALQANSTNIDACFELVSSINVTSIISFVSNHSLGILANETGFISIVDLLTEAFFVVVDDVSHLRAQIPSLYLRIMNYSYAFNKCNALGLSGVCIKQYSKHTESLSRDLTALVTKSLLNPSDDEVAIKSTMEGDFVYERDRKYRDIELFQNESMKFVVHAMGRLHEFFSSMKKDEMLLIIFHIFYEEDFTEV